MFRIQAKNFLSFEELTFDFSNRGLCLIEGENETEPLQKSNGSGKTNLVDALSWGLYGESLKGKAPDKVVNLKAKKNCEVTVEWGDYKVIRYRKHTKFKNDLQFYRGSEELTKKSNADTQEAICKTLGLNYDSFIRSIYFQQSTLNNFATAKDSEQKAIIEDILSINLLTVAQDVSKDKVKDFVRLLDEQEKKASLINARVADARNRVIQMKTRSEQFETQRKSDRLTIEGQIAMLEIKRSKSEPEFNMEQAKLAVAATENLALLLPGVELQLSNLQTERSRKQQTQNDLTWQCKSANDKINEIDRQQKKFNAIMDSRQCPTCGQTITDVKKMVVDEDWEPKLAKHKADIATWNTQLITVMGEIPALDADIKAKQEDIKKKRELITLANQMRQKISTEEFRLKEMAMLADRILEQQKRLAEVEARENPFEQQLSEEQGKVNTAESELNEIRTTSLQIKLDKAYYDYWVDGFGNAKLKSYIMDAITPLLNERANYYSQFLTGGAFQIEISTQTVLKSGEIRDKFSVNVKHASGADYDLSSGGERKRIDICILLALQDLVGTRANQPISLLIMDEVSENLDDIGVERMLELLHNIVSTKGTCLYITHHEGMKPLFPNSVKVTKQNGISRLTC